MSVFSRVQKRLLRTYFKVFYSAPVQRIFGPKFSTPLDPSAPAIWQTLSDELAREGIAVTTVDELFGTGTFAMLRSWAEEERKSKEKRSLIPGKQFIQYLWADPFPVDFKNPFLVTVLSKHMLSLAETYLGTRPVLYNLTLNVTVPVGSEAAQSSQRWHRDPEDIKLLKMFIYLSPVDEESGPFTYVRQSASGLRWGSVFPARTPEATYPPLGRVEQKVDPSFIQSYAAPAGTVIFANTAGLHKGGHARSRERFMFTAGFHTPVSPWPSRFMYPDGWEGELVSRGLSAHARQAVAPHFRQLSSRLLSMLIE
ncbi:MAG: hypothetical protein V4674_01615 [Patescibacteria group bacterium]